MYLLKTLLINIFLIFITNISVAGTPELDYLQGEWIIVKWASSPIGSWGQEEGDACIGNRLIIQGDQAVVWLAGRRYEGKLGEIISKKIQEIGKTDFFNPDERNSTDPKDLGLPNDLTVENLEMSNDIPFKFWILIKGKNQIIFFRESGSFLMKRTKAVRREAKCDAPEMNEGWAFLDRDRFSDAIQSFQSAIEKGGNHCAEPYLGLGYVYKEMSYENPFLYRKLAIENYKKFVDSDSGDQSLRKAALAEIKTVQEYVAIIKRLTPTAK